MTILAALDGLYERLAARDEVASPGYAPAKIAYELVLAADGTPLELADIRARSGKTPRPRDLIVPVPADTRTSGIKPMFLWDKTAYVFGLVNTAPKGATPVPGQARRTADEHVAFIAFHQELLADTDDPGLLIFLAFLDRWRPEMFEALGFSPEALDQNIVLRLDGEHRHLHDRPAAKRLWAEANADAGDVGMCLVTGETAPLARLHPMLRGVPGAQSSGAALVSFNLPAFDSYGRSQGGNAPVSTHAAFAYTTALNWLLTHQGVRIADHSRSVEITDHTHLSGRRRLVVADTTVVFWADARGVGEEAADTAEDWFAELLDPQTPTEDDGQRDAAEAGRIRTALDDVVKGRAVGEIDAGLEEETRMYLLGLAPNAARLAVRFWLVDSFGNLARSIARHWQDLAIEPPGWKGPPPAWSLVLETALQGKADNVPPRLAGEVIRAILTGERYPRTLLSGVVARIRADGQINGRRAAICKAVVNRLLRKEDDEGRIPVGLDEESDNIAYNLGRLFAAYAYAESSFAERGATIRDKYIGSASATPRRVFPILMRGYEHNRSSLAKSIEGFKKGAGHKADRAVAQILDRYDGDVPFPDVLKLEDQAFFFVGFYHQHQNFFKKKDLEPAYFGSEDEE